MAKATDVSIVHDVVGNILAVARPSPGAKVVVLSGAGQSVLVTSHDPDQASSLINSHHVDVGKRALVRNSG